ncbi:hypothetical protein [Paraburkholderia pallida]|uniref:Uncharacterized protein n=1 Tax=Paraburkholderia pallida TaxID=2547399 RepID=A0A4P7CYB9_9BURK|nr:hypothetical protein [Paraburkholderia pallida]QBQ99224.1 hypothetical protein E1956_18645 [Paraburkholderia pallida]
MTTELEKLKTLVVALSEQVVALATRETVHVAAIHALAESHPSPAEVERRFRDLIETMLGCQDDSPPTEAQQQTQLQTTNAFLASLKREGPR